MKKYLLFLILFSIVGLLIWGIYLPQRPFSREELIFVIEKGQGSREIAVNLEEQGLIKSTPIFRLYVAGKGVSRKLQAGPYQLSFSMNVSQMVEKFVVGDVIKEEITLIEGWNLRDVGWYFEGKGMFMAEELFELVGFPLIDYSQTTDLPEPKDFSLDYDFLEDKPENVNLEGYLFPDTYQIGVGESIEEIVRRLLANFDRKLVPDLRAEIENQNKTIFEIITMASLLEKEVRTLEEKKMVSGVLWKRLENNMPLQVDATITYITGKKTVKISKEETQIDSPYNSYKYAGLPLGPISNPGIESILAAIYPEESQYWYYLSLPSGETIFSKTLEEHNLAKAQYLN